MSDSNRYELTYRNHEGVKIQLCVKAENVSEAIEAARHEIPALKLYPGRIISVVRGCS